MSHSICMGVHATPSLCVHIDMAQGVCHINTRVCTCSETEPQFCLPTHWQTATVSFLGVCLPPWLL